jgi:hypothetical protein
MAATANVFALLGDGDDDIQQLAAKAAVAAPAPVKAAAPDAKKPAPKADAGEASTGAGIDPQASCIITGGSCTMLRAQGGLMAPHTCNQAAAEHAVSNGAKHWGFQRPHGCSCMGCAWASAMQPHACMRRHAQ